MHERFPSDESDDEWDAAVEQEYGSRGRLLRQPADTRMDEEVEIIDAVQHAFQIYDVDVGLTNMGIGDGASNEGREEAATKVEGAHGEA